MKEQSTSTESASRVCYETMEAHARGRIQSWLQDVILRFKKTDPKACATLTRDLRPDSPTFGRYATVMLSAENRKMLYIPEKFAHGFITLEGDSEVFYQMSQFYSPESARGFRWNDPCFGIRLPLEVAVISERDRDYPDFRAQACV